MRVRIVSAWCPICTAVTDHLLAVHTLCCPYCGTARVVEAEVPVLSVQLVAELDGPPSDLYPA